MQTGWKDDPGFFLPEAFFNRHDTRMHLMPLGVEQAKATGEWLRQEFADGFELALSWNGGAWEHFSLRKFSDDKLLGLAQNYPRLFSQVEQC